VLCKVTVALGSKGNDLLLPILLKHRIPLLVGLVRLAQCLQSHYSVKRFFVRCVPMQSDPAWQPSLLGCAQRGFSVVLRAREVVPCRVEGRDSSTEFGSHT